MSKVLDAVRGVVVRGELDLVELDGAYEGVVLPFRLNWSRAMKDRQRALQRETVELQMRYARLRELAKDEEAWRAEDEALSKGGDKNWAEWMGFWAEVLLEEVGTVEELAEALPEQHWVWVTAEVGRRAREYEEEAVKKVNAGRSRSSAKRGGGRRRSGKKPE